MGVVFECDLLYLGVVFVNFDVFSGHKK
jgi:hypothetical protein